jgi:uncharacterized damage-inducible protein DinB
MTEPHLKIFQDFAQYNLWANGRIYGAAARLPAADAACDRGAFFKSVLGTLNHLLLVDRLWLARLQGENPGPMRLDTILHHDLAGLTAARQAEDKIIIAYVETLRAPDLPAILRYNNTAGLEFIQPRQDVLLHFFNHQTHHRGQTHDLICQLSGPDAAPGLDLLMWQRLAGAGTK